MAERCLEVARRRPWPLKQTGAPRRRALLGALALSPPSVPPVRTAGEYVWPVPERAGPAEPAGSEDQGRPSVEREPVLHGAYP